MTLNDSGLPPKPGPVCRSTVCVERVRGGHDFLRHVAHHDGWGYVIVEVTQDMPLNAGDKIILWVKGVTDV